LGFTATDLANFPDQSKPEEISPFTPKIQEAVQQIVNEEDDNLDAETKTDVLPKLIAILRQQ
jgi:hypothetical protein